MPRVDHRLEDFWRSCWLDRTPKERIEATLLVAIVAVGIAFRSNRYWIDPIGLWGDEAKWGRHLVELPLLTPSFRPLGFMAICRGLVEAFFVDERLLRLPSYLASVASIFLFADIGKRLLKNRAVFFVMLAVVAVQPMLIDFAKEFKPYALELFVHLMMLWSGLRLFEKQTLKRWVTLLTLLPLVFFVAYNAIFFYPVIFSLLGWRALLDRNKRVFAIVCGAAAACLLAIGVITLLVFAPLPENEDDSAFWGKKYGVFYVDDGRANQVQWQVRKFAELVAMPGSGRLFWQPPAALQGRPARELAGLDELSWALLYVLGLVALGRTRRWTEGALLVVPVLTALAFNLLSKWPWGAFRVNLFLLAYIIPVAFIGLDRWASWGRNSRWIAPTFSVALHLMPMVAFGFGAHSEKRAWTGHSELPRILDRIRVDREAQLELNPAAPREVIIVDGYTCETLGFYLKHHAYGSKQYGHFIQNDFDWRCVVQPKDIGTAVRARRGLPTWVIVSNRTIVESTFAHVRGAGRVIIDERPAYNHRLIKLSN
jgi:hypothetical protein